MDFLIVLSIINLIQTYFIRLSCSKSFFLIDASLKPRSEHARPFVCSISEDQRCQFMKSVGGADAGRSHQVVWPHQLNLPPNSCFSSDFGHFISEIHKSKKV